MHRGHKKGTPTLPQDPLSPIAEGSPTHSPPQCCGTSRCLCFAPRPFDQLWWQPSGPAVLAARVAAAVQLANVTYFQLPLIMQLHSQCCRSPPASRPAWWHCAGTGMLHCHRAGTSPGSSAAPGLGFSCPFCTALNSSPPQHHARVATASPARPHASHGVPVSRVISLCHCWDCPICPNCPSHSVPLQRDPDPKMPQGRAYIPSCAPVPFCVPTSGRRGCRWGITSPPTQMSARPR